MASNRLSSVNMRPIELQPLIEALAELQVQYVIIGGVALLLYGAPITTRDVDISIAFEKENLKNLAEALNRFEPRLRNGHHVRLDEFAFGGEFVTYFTNVGVIQVVNRFIGFDTFQDLENSSDVITVAGVNVRVASLDALEIMKSSTGRDKDKPHLDIIRALKDQRKT
jgi:predicted nucleotidyltransferase